MSTLILNYTLYAAFTQTNKLELVCLFRQQGWLVRKSSWTDYELQNEWAVLELDGPDSAPLLHGIICYTELHWKLLMKLLTHVTPSYQVEVYQEDGTLVCERHWM